MKRAFLATVALSLLTAPAVAHSEPAHSEPAPADPGQSDPARAVSAERLRADVEKLVSFGTRHTLSTQNDPERGIGAAVDWGAAEFRRISAQCGDCLEVVLPETTIQGRRVPDPTRLRDVVAIQRGTERPDEVVIVQGHIDSRASDVMDAASAAPGANDDGSGTALAIEAARVLSRHKYPSTIVYALLSGEEQGLYGAKALVDYAQAQGWTIKAVLNNDTVGNICGSDGMCDADHVRVFSEGPRADLTAPLRAAQARNGGENDAPSRNLARYVGDVARGAPSGIAVRQIFRNDRLGRGGDHTPFVDAGYPAIRLTEAVENYDHQHQDPRTGGGTVYGDTVAGMNFDYLAAVTRLNVRVLDDLARAPMPPAPRISGAVTPDTVLEWQPVPGAVNYAIWRRRTDQPHWQDQPVIAQVVATNARLEGVRVDDWFFGVSACSASGACSPVASAVPAGAFAPIATGEDDSA